MMKLFYNLNESTSIYSVMPSEPFVQMHFNTSLSSTRKYDIDTMCTHGGTMGIYGDS